MQCTYVVLRSTMMRQFRYYYYNIIKRPHQSSLFIIIINHALCARVTIINVRRAGTKCKTFRVPQLLNMLLQDRRYNVL